MQTTEKVIDLLYEVLNLDKNRYKLTSETALIGAIPEFDSMAVISIVSALENEFGFMAEDDELDASLFETVGSVIQYVQNKL